MRIPEEGESPKKKRNSRNGKERLNRAPKGERIWDLSEEKRRFVQKCHPPIAKGERCKPNAIVKGQGGVGCEENKQ